MAVYLKKMMQELKKMLKYEYINNRISKIRERMCKERIHNKQRQNGGGSSSAERIAVFCQVKAQ